MSAPFVGEARIGAAGAEGGSIIIVVKLQAFDQLVPLTFDAFVRQKYVVPFASPLTVTLVRVAPDWSKNVVPNMLESETCTSYIVAPPELPQLRPSERDWLPAPFAGERKTGAAGAEGGAIIIVVKLQMLDQLVPPAFVAFARQ